MRYESSLTRSGSLTDGSFKKRIKESFDALR